MRNERSDPCLSTLNTYKDDMSLLNVGEGQETFLTQDQQNLFEM